MRKGPQLLRYRRVATYSGLIACSQSLENFTDQYDGAVLGTVGGVCVGRLENDIGGCRENWQGWGDGDMCGGVLCWRWGTFRMCQV